MISVNVVIESISFDMQSRITFSHPVEIPDFDIVEIIGINSEGRQLKDPVFRKVVLVRRNDDNTMFDYVTANTSNQSSE